MNELEKKEETLEERMNLIHNGDHIGSDIFVSEIGTVSRRVNGEMDEQSFDRFIKDIQNNIRNGENIIKYDKKSNKFYLIEMSQQYNDSLGDWETCKIAHKIDINEKSMEDYARGKFDNFTMKLHDLYLETDLKAKSDAKKDAKVRERNAIIAKANNSHDELSPIEARTYLDYLKEQDRRKTKEVVKKGAQLTAVTGIPIAGGVIAGTICFAPAALGITALAAALGVTAASLVEGTVNMFVFGDDQLEILPIQRTKRLIRDIKEKVRELKVNRTKEKKLRKIKYVDKLVMPNSVTIEEKDPIEPLELKDHIMNEIDSVVDKLAHINTEDRSILLAELKDLLNMYIERKTQIIGQDKKTSRVEADSLAALRTDVCKKLAKIEMKINDIKTRDAKKLAMTEEAKLLTDKIERIENSDPEELDRMLDDNAVDSEETIKHSAK